MRVVYGAGAVAAMSIMAVGLVQPDWALTADQAPTDDSWSTGDPGALAALVNGKSEAGQPDPSASRGEAADTVPVRHVIRYVFLKPGQTPPPGATVISATPPPRAARTRPHNPDPTPSARPRNPGGGSQNATPRPTPRPTQAPQATPRPTPTTRQSGRH